MNNKLTPERIEERSADNGTAGGQRMRNSPDYITEYADGKRAGLLGVSRCMHMMVDTQRCTSLGYFRGFEAEKLGVSGGFLCGRRLGDE